ncbi:MAG: restriction endonuclease subunit S [Fimbriimonadia bacterium]|jgi:type I restriction enzyme S subunit
MIKLGEVAEFARDGVLPNHIKSGTLFVGLENIKKGGGFEGVSTVDEGELASTKFAFTPKHVLYGKLRPYLAKIALPDFEGVCSTDIIPILPGPKLDRRYLAHYLLTPKMIALASDRAAGANLPRLSPRVLIDFPIPLPPIDEQRRIAAMLDKAEELRAKRRAAIALLDQLPQAIFLEMFGDGVPLKSLSELAELKRGPFGGALKKEFFVESGFKVYEQGNVIADDFEIGNYFIDERRFSKMRGFEIAPDDLLVSCSGTLGRIAQVPRNAAPGLINQALLRLRVRNDQMRPTFLRLALQSHAVQQVLAGFSRGSGLQNFPPMSEVRSLLIPAPDLHAQDKFIVRVEQIAGIRAAYQSVLDESHALRTSLQWSAFSGDCG